MNNDFFYALIIGWIILFCFWSAIVGFIFLRKPATSNLSKKFVIKSLFYFGLVLIFLFILKPVDSFL